MLTVTLFHLLAINAIDVCQSMVQYGEKVGS